MTGNAFSFRVDFVVNRRTEAGLTLLVPYFPFLADDAFQALKVKISGTGDAGFVFSQIRLVLRTSASFDGLVEDESSRANHTDL